MTDEITTPLNITGPITPEEIRSSPLGDIAKRMFSVELDKLTDEQLFLVCELDLSMQFSEMTISASEKRMIQQYSPMDIHASLKYDLGDLKRVILNRAQTAETGNKIASYLLAKRAALSLIEDRFSAVEGKLRSMIREQMRSHGIKVE